MNGKEKQRLRRGRKAETMLRARTRTEKDVFSKTERLKQALETADAAFRLCGIYIFRGTLSPVFQ